MFKVLNQICILTNSECQRYEFIRVFPTAIMFNRIIVPRNRAKNIPIDQRNSMFILRSHIPTLNSLALCVKMNWMPILVIIIFLIISHNSINCHYDQL